MKKEKIEPKIRESQESEWNKVVSPKCRKVQEHLLKIADMIQKLEQE